MALKNIEHLKKEIEKLKKIKGEIRGSSLVSEVAFIRKTKGEDAWQELEAYLKEFDCSFEGAKIKPMQFCPLWFEAVWYFLMQEVLGFKFNDFREMGVFEAKNSFITRIFSKYLLSVPLMVEKGPLIWKKYHTEGILKMKADDEKKEVVIDLIDFPKYPGVCANLTGFFATILEMILGGPADCFEKKCFRNNHQFLLSWSSSEKESIEQNLGQEIISSQELEDLSKIKGMVRGIGLRGDAELVLKKQGKEGLKKLEEEMARFNHPINYKKLGIMDFYPLSTASLNLLLAQRLFGFKDSDFEFSGEMQAENSLILRVFLKYFFNLEKALSQVSKMWKKHYTIGNLEVVEFNEEEGRMVLGVRNFLVYPLHFKVIKGYLKKTTEIFVGQPVDCREMKKVSFGDNSQDYLLNW